VTAGEALLVLCTCPDETVAQRIAHALVEERLAACVNRLSGLRSVYRWQGTLSDEPEVLLIVKTTATRFEALEMRLKALHPYEVPEIIGIPLTYGSSDYLGWLAAEATP
jgi:periplasmic divalent cation tolerance protein